MSLKERIISRAMLTPYRKGHLNHADGSLYMERFALFETTHLSARVHHIATPDNDRVLHDHPWPFVSYVLRGGYVEELPLQPVPCWIGLAGEACVPAERTYQVTRRAGSMAYRGAACRHRISHVEPDTWTMFVYGKFVNDWGFYTPQGKIYWQHYLDHFGSSFSKENNRGGE